MKIKTHSHALLLALALPSCTVQPLAAPVPSVEVQTDLYHPVGVSRDVDILFMIDDSPSMEQEQANLRRNMPHFMDELKKIEGGLPNVHIGVVSSDLGSDGAVIKNACGGRPQGMRPGGARGIFRTKPGCGLQEGALFISSLDDGKTNNFQGDLSDVFSCIADLGTAGCGYEHQLEATRVALTESLTPENAGFLRADAYLAIILISDEDDCSVDVASTLFDQSMSTYQGTAASFRCAREGHLCNGQTPPVGTFSAPLASCAPNEGGKLLGITGLVESIRALKPGNTDKILVSGIFGWPDDESTARYEYGPTSDGLDYLPACQSAQGKAEAGLRLRQFVKSFGENGLEFSICRDDFRPAMEKIAEKLRNLVEKAPCLTAPLVDTKGAVADVQPDCQVADREPSGRETRIPQCGGGNAPPCWELVRDDRCLDSGFRLNTQRAVAAPVGTTQSIKCLTCAKSDDPRCKP